MSRWSNRRVSRQRIDAARASSAIAGNTVLNLLGTGIPLLLAVASIPIIIATAGVERFGILTISWAVLGYFGLFDLGLGRATTKFLAEAFEDNRVIEVRGIFWTSMVSNTFLGLISASILAALAPMLVYRVLNVSAEVQPEALVAFYLMAGAVPVVTVTTALRGALEAQHRFGLLNALQVPTSALTQAAPLLVLPFSYSLTWLVGALVLSRLLGVVVYLIGALWHLEAPFEGPFFLRGKLRALLSFGGWITVTNTIVPLMFNVDKFVIGALSSATAVAYYATPYEVATRLWVLPLSLVRTMFPIFSAKQETEERTRLYTSAVKVLALILAPVVATLITFAPDILRLWISADFAVQSTLVLQILAVGVFVHSLALVPYTLIQGLGRPDITAKFHLLQAPFYLILLWFGVQYLGIVGAALAWVTRLGADAAMLAWYIGRTGSLSELRTGRGLQQTLVLSVILLASNWLLDVSTSGLVLKSGGWFLILGAASLWAWRRLLTLEERNKAIGYIGKLSAFIRAFYARRQKTG